MQNRQYYVYALIDPRNNEYFYIGKGKGKRYLSHLKTNKRDFNLTKLERIGNIKNSGFEIKIEILFSNITEDTAFELEKILIYKLGRTFLSEGILTNIAPGGKWKKSESVLYGDEFKIDFDLTKLDFFEQEKFLSIIKISNFNYLNTKNNQQVIYRYSTNGNLEKIESLNCFLIYGFGSNTIELLKAMRENELPIFSNSIYSKIFTEKIYISPNLPFADFDIIDEQFNKDFDRLNNEKENFELELKIDNVKRMSVIKSKELITLNSYYPSGNKKSFRQRKDNQFTFNSFDWFENGNLKTKQIYKEGYSGYSRTTYFENGNKYIEISNFNLKKTYIRWFVNGNIEVELIENTGHVYYSENGQKIKTIPLVNKNSFTQEEFNLEFPKKELTEQEIKEKENSDEDWLEYSKIFN